MATREQWTEQQVDPTGFGDDHAWRVREYPGLGIVLSIAQQGLSTWDLARRCRTQRLTPGAGEVSGDLSTAVALAPDGGLLYLRRGTLWKLPLGSLTARPLLDGLPGKHNLLALCPDNDTVATSHDHPHEQGFVVASLAGGEVLWEMGTRRGSPIFSPTGLHLMVSNECYCQSGSDTVDFEVYEARSGAFVIDGFSTCWDESLYWSEDGRDVVLQAIDDRRPKRTWQVHQGRERPLQPCRQEGNWMGVRRRHGLEASGGNP